MPDNIWGRLWLEVALAFDFARSFFEPVGAYRIGHLVIVQRRYRRRKVTILRDGTTLKRGDKLVKLHLKLFLPRFKGELTELSYSRYLYELVAPELPALAVLLRSDPAWADFKALTGQSHLVGWFTERAGFETHLIPDGWRYMVDFLGRGAMLLADPTPRCLLKVIRPGRVRPPRECWASRHSFLNHHATPVEIPVLRRLFGII